MGGFFDPVGTMLQGISSVLNDAYKSLLSLVIHVLISASFPEYKIITSDWFSLRLGATYGLASTLVSLFAVGVATWVVVTPMKRHGKKISRAVSTLVLVMLFGLLFYPLYALGDNFSKALGVGIVNVLRGTSQTDANSLTQAINSIALPQNILGQIIALIFDALIGLVLMLEVYAMNFMAILIIMFYPLAIALRPLGQKASMVFNACNAGIFTTLLATPAMIFFYALPLFLNNILPAPITVLIAILGGLVAAATPIVMWIWMYRLSREVFGTIDATVSGKIDIDSMPAVDTREMTESVSEQHDSPVVAFGKGMMAAVAEEELFSSSGNLSEDLKKGALQGASFAATAMGHPWVGAAIDGVDRVRRNNASPPPGPPPSAPLPPPPPPRTPTP